MADKDIAGVRAAIDLWIDGWTFSPENPWSLDKFEAILDPDCMVIDDYGGELSLLYGHKDYAGIWGPMVAKYMKIWKILPEEDSIQIWTEGSIACASFILRGGGGDGGARRFGGGALLRIERLRREGEKARAEQGEFAHHMGAPFSGGWLRV